MNFDSKNYMFYKLLDTNNGLDSENISAIIDLLGDFKVRPGSLKVVEKEDVIGLAVECNSFAPENIEWNTLRNIGISYNLIDMEGFYNGNQIKLCINDAYFYNASKNDCNFAMTIINKSKGIHTLKSNQFALTNSSISYKPLYAFYDKNTLESLINNYGYDMDSLYNIDPLKLDKEGIIPDKSCFTSCEELGFDKKYEFVHSLLTDMRYEDLENKFDDIVSDKEEKNSESFIKYLKRTNGHKN